MTEKIIILDTLEKIEQFSKGLPPYTRAPQFLSGDTKVPGLFINGTPFGGNGELVDVSDIFTHVKNKTISDQDNVIPEFYDPIEISDLKPISQELDKNLGYLGYPCLKANFTTLAREKRTKYPIIRVRCWLDQDDVIIQVSADFFLNDNRTFSDPKTFFIPFLGEPEYIDSVVSPPTNTKEEIDNLINTIAVPDLENCPPKKISNFYANDQDWGIVPLSTKVTKSVLLENRGETRLVINDFKPISSENFKILNLERGAELKPGQSITFDVEYSPFEDAEVTHTITIVYDVNEDGDLTKPVELDKIFSVLKGTGDVQDLIDDVIDDLGDDLTDDDNGTYVNKPISKIISKSRPTEEWRTYPLWKCVGERLNTFFTGSNGVTNNKFYLPVYNETPGTPESYHQFDISYGHRLGSGSRYTLDGLLMKPSQVMYKKYLIECYEPIPTSSRERPTKFQFKNGVNGDSVYFIQMDRDQFRDMLDPGNFELCLSPLTSSTNQLVNTGSNVRIDQTSATIYTLIDESWDTKQNATDQKSLKDWYYVTSGSKRDGVYGEPSDNAWGIVFPRIGLIVLDGTVLDQSCSFNTVTASIDGDNISKLFLSISGSSSTNDSRNFSGSFFARSAERVVKETYFCRIRQDEFNYSNNPTYVSGSDSYFKYTYFNRNPHSYITTLGLYNKKGLLLAVGKLKRPILKNNTKSYVFEVKVRLN